MASEDADDPKRLALLASALAGRTVAVAPATPGEAAWTDGVTVFGPGQVGELCGIELESSLFQLIGELGNLLRHPHPLRSGECREETDAQCNDEFLQVELLSSRRARKAEAHPCLADFSLQPRGGQGAMNIVT